MLECSRQEGVNFLKRRKCYEIRVKGREIKICTNRYVSNSDSKEILTRCIVKRVIGERKE